MPDDCCNRRAFTRSDLLALLVTLTLGAALALAATRQMRQEAQNASSLSQLRWLAGATSSYAADNSDLFWSYSWKAGPLPHSDPTLPTTASSDLQAAAIQAVDTMRRLSGRSDIELSTSWVPHVYYNHLPLVSYLARSLPDFNLIAPGDEHRLNWARDPEAFDMGAFLPFQPDPSGVNKRWPYSSSYLAPAAWWDVQNQVYQGATHGTYVLPAATEFGGVPLHRVVYPSQKVLLHDQEQRELGASPRYCIDPAARTATLMGDGSAGLRATVEANAGWNPAAPASRAPTAVTYVPRAWEAPEAGRFWGRYRWTRGGIEGPDFGGPEIDTGQ